MRGVLAVILIAHAVAHLVGFAVPWRLMTSVEVPYRTTILDGLIDVGPAGIKAVGVMWLVMAAAFAVVAIGLVARTSWHPVLLPLIAASAVLCILQLPEARFGLLANGVIVALLLIGRV